MGDAGTEGQDVAGIVIGVTQVIIINRVLAVTAVKDIGIGTGAAGDLVIADAAGVGVVSPIGGGHCRAQGIVAGAAVEGVVTSNISNGIVTITPRY